ncbi:hypothetical protein [Paenarthrobacter aromaticivorans]|uniref:hypothetical protein n=1 Tax=Paenarthrobacter aromaticivorans TaxID=2849150 RepID=UPI003A7FDD5D
MKIMRVMSSVLAAALSLGVVVSLGSPAHADEPASWAGTCNVPGLAFAPVISKR